MSAFIAAVLLLVQQSLPDVSPFAAAKARTLLRDHLPCLGCHRFAGEGGRIGPDLSDVGVRLSGVDIYAMIARPGRTRPGTLMPLVPMPDGTRRLVAGFLAAQRRPGSSGVSPRPAAVPPASDTPGAALYARHCAACHGDRGGGDGWNAEFLPVRPAIHADPAAMARRTDDRLYDAIAAGGAVLGRSPRMPPFGLTLASAEIRSLVRYIRALCRCQGPAWSRDGAPP